MGLPAPIFPALVHPPGGAAHRAGSLAGLGIASDMGGPAALAPGPESAISGGAERPENISEVMGPENSVSEGKSIERQGKR